MEQALESESRREGTEDKDIQQEAEPDDLELDEAVNLLEEGSERFESPSDFRIAEDDKHKDIVAELSGPLVEDFGQERGLGQRAFSRLTTSEPVLVYDPAGFTAEIFDSYRQNVWPRDPDIGDFQAGVVAGYLLADSISEAGNQVVQERSIDPVSGVQARVNGRTVTPEENDKLVEKLLYDEPATFFPHAAVHHFELRRSDRLESELRGRANSPGSEGAEERYLKQMFDRFERYEGNMLFKDFMQTYRQHYGEDSPLNWAVENILENDSPHPEGLVDGMYSNPL